MISEFARLALDLADSHIARQRAIESLRLANELVLGVKQTHDLVILGRATIEARQHTLGIAYLKHAKRLADRDHNPYGPLRDLVRPYILRRMKTDKSIIADLPDKTEVKAFCHLSRKQAALYHDAVEELAEALEGAGVFAGVVDPEDAAMREPAGQPVRDRRAAREAIRVAPVVVQGLGNFRCHREEPSRRREQETVAHLGAEQR